LITPFLITKRRKKMKNRKHLPLNPKPEKTFEEAYETHSKKRFTVYGMSHIAVSRLTSEKSRKEPNQPVIVIERIEIIEGKTIFKPVIYIFKCCWGFRTNCNGVTLVEYYKHL